MPLSNSFQRIDKDMIQNLIKPPKLEKVINLLKLTREIKPILVVGDVGIDKYTLGEVSRISPEAPVPVLEVSSENYKLGLAANVSENLSSFQIKSSMLSLVGEDFYGDLLLSLLKKEGIGVDGIILDPSRRTTLKERITTPTQQICRVDHETKLPLSEDKENTAIKNISTILDHHSGVIIEDYGKGFLTPKILNKIIREGEERGISIFVDPSRTTSPHLYKGATLLKPNLEEAKIIVGKLGYDPQKSVEELATLLSEKLQISQVVITLGAKGMAIYDSQNPLLKSDTSKHFLIIPTMAKEVFDVSGAGDTTISLLSSLLVAGCELYDAAWIANCGAGVVVGKRGTATVSEEELTQFYGAFISYFSL